MQAARDMVGMLVGAKNLLLGMGVTLRNFLRRPVTVQYPEQRHELPPGYRAIPALLEDAETGKLKCTGCGVCARNCPIKIIATTAKVGEDGKKTVDEYSIDMSKCMICSMCVESCPFAALAMFDHYELATADKASLMYDRERLRISNLRKAKDAADRRLAKVGHERTGLPGTGPSNPSGRR